MLDKGVVSSTGSPLHAKFLTYHFERKKRSEGPVYIG